MKYYKLSIYVIYMSCTFKTALKHTSPLPPLPKLCKIIFSLEKSELKELFQLCCSPLRDSEVEEHQSVSHSWKDNGRITSRIFPLSVLNIDHCRLATLSRRQKPTLPYRRYRSMSPAGRQSLQFYNEYIKMIKPHCSSLQSNPSG